MKIIVHNNKGKWQASLEGKSWTCAIGKNGTIPALDKVEGDGKTPLGEWEIIRVLYRAIALN